jgi:hypothetical protein
VLITEEQWVVEYRDEHQARDLTSPTKTSKQAALSYARDLIRGHHTICRIVGPSEVVEKAAIEQRAKDNPE